MVQLFTCEVNLLFELTQMEIWENYYLTNSLFLLHKYFFFLIRKPGKGIIFIWLVPKKQYYTAVL